MSRIASKEQLKPTSRNPFDCLICENSFDSTHYRPFILHAGHSFCEICIKELPEDQSNHRSNDSNDAVSNYRYEYPSSFALNQQHIEQHQQSNDQSKTISFVRCPLCNAVVRRDLAAVNHLVLDIIQSNSPAESKEDSPVESVNQSPDHSPDDTPACDLCLVDGLFSLSTNHCFDCYQWMCDDHCRLHKRKRHQSIHSHHTINQSSELRKDAYKRVRFPIRRCSIHQSTDQSKDRSFDDNVLIKYCVDCSQFICLHCEIEDEDQSNSQPNHKDHHMQSIADAWDHLSNQSINLIASADVSLDTQKRSISQIDQSIDLISVDQQESINQTKTIMEHILHTLSKKSSANQSIILSNIDQFATRMKHTLHDQSDSLKSVHQNISESLDQLKRNLISHDFLSVPTTLNAIAESINQSSQSINQYKPLWRPFPVTADSLIDEFDSFLDRWFESFREQVIAPFQASDEQKNEIGDEGIDHSDGLPIGPALWQNIMREIRSINQSYAHQSSKQNNTPNGKSPKALGNQSGNPISSSPQQIQRLCHQLHLHFLLASDGNDDPVVQSTFLPIKNFAIEARIWDLSQHDFSDIATFISYQLYASISQPKQQISQSSNQFIMLCEVIIPLLEYFGPLVESEVSTRCMNSCELAFRAVDESLDQVTDQSIAIYCWAFRLLWVLPANKSSVASLMQAFPFCQSVDQSAVRSVYMTSLTLQRRTSDELLDFLFLPFNRSIPPSVSLSSVHHLDLSFSNLSALMFEEWSQLLDMVTCRNLILSSCKISSTACTALCSAIKHSMDSSKKSSLRWLARLDLSYNPLMDAGCREISKLTGRLLSLESINLSSCKISEKGCLSLSDKLKHSSSLIELNLSWNNIGETGCQFLMECFSEAGHHLRLLDLSGTALDSHVIGMLCERVREMPGLSHLALSNCSLGSHGTQILADALVVLSHLQSLDLGVNRIDDVACSKLASVFSMLPMLTDLKLSGNAIGGDKHEAYDASGITALSENIYHLQSLRFIDLSGNRLNGRTGRILIDALVNAHLLDPVTIKLKNIGMDQQSAQELQRRFAQLPATVSVIMTVNQDNSLSAKLMKT